jgi:shikimate dehydrogenase
MKEVFDIDDLADRVRLDLGAAHPARLAVIGRPVAHSLSPQMHQAALDAHGIDARYIRIDIAPAAVGEALRRMRDLGFTGCNVTVPHKIEALETCDSSETIARLLGAVNTIAFTVDGIHGSNTDAPGFLKAFEEAFGRSPSGLAMLIAGAGGGAGRTLATACAMAGASRLVLVNRTESKANVVAEQLRSATHSPPKTLVLSPDDPSLCAIARDCDAIVNATSLGLSEDDPPPLPAAAFRPGQMVFDAVYRNGPTSLVRLAGSLGCKSVDGRLMLLHQGALAFQRWFPGTEPLESMRRALQSATGGS